MTKPPIGTEDHPTFTARYGPLFEHSPWIAAQSWRPGGYPGPEAMLQAMVQTLRNAGTQAQRTLFQAHPELAGPETEAGTLTQASTTEQSSAGLDRLTPEDLARQRRLNDAYRAHHGIPFIICVRNHTRATILAELERRTPRPTAIEHEEALTQVIAIARLRLAQLLTPTHPAQ